MSGALKNHLVKLVVGAGKATPSPPIGPALGSKGVKSIDFCKEFNARSQEYIAGTPLPCRVIVRPDRTFSFELRTPQTSWLIFNAADVAANRRGKSRGANKPGHEIVGTISLKHVYEIAKVKATEQRLSGIPLQSLCRAIIWQTKSMGIKVVA